MNAIRINVNKQMDGYSFSLSPSIRDSIRKDFPKAHPANNIFVAYDVKSSFEFFQGKLENYIFPVLLGVDDENELKKIDEIQFIDTQTGNLLHKVTPRDQKI